MTAAYRLHQGLQVAAQRCMMVVESRTTDDSVVLLEKPMDGLELVRPGLRQVRIAGDAKRYRWSRSPYCLAILPAARR